MTENNGLPTLLKPRDAAAALSVSERTLWQLTKDGEIPAVRFGTRSVRYDPADLRAWIDRQKTAPTVDISTTRL